MGKGGGVNELVLAEGDEEVARVAVCRVTRCRGGGRGGGARGGRGDEGGASDDGGGLTALTSLSLEVRLLLVLDTDELSEDDSGVWRYAVLWP